MKNMEIGKRIRQQRKALNISVADVAAYTGLSKATIHRYENGEIKDIEKMSKEEAVEIASSLCDVIDSGDIDEIKALVQELIKEVIVDEETLHVYWKFA